MKKIPSLWRRDRETGKITRDFALDFCADWRATVKVDGTSCRVTSDGLLWKRYDRKPTKQWAKTARHLCRRTVHRDGAVAGAARSRDRHQCALPGGFIMIDGIGDHPDMQGPGE